MWFQAEGRREGGQSRLDCDGKKRRRAAARGTQTDQQGPNNQISVHTTNIQEHPTPPDFAGINQPASQPATTTTSFPHARPPTTPPPCSPGPLPWPPRKAAVRSTFPLLHLAGSTLPLASPLALALLRRQHLCSCGCASCLPTAEPSFVGLTAAACGRWWWCGLVSWDCCDGAALVSGSEAHTMMSLMMVGVIGRGPPARHTSHQRRRPPNKNAAHSNHRKDAPIGGLVRAMCEPAGAGARGKEIFTYARPRKASR